MSKSFWLLSAGITALATPAYAQDEPATSTTTAGTEAAAVQDEGQPDIVITAQGRRQLLQDVPLAVQAVGGQQLQNTGANDIRQLNQLAPSLLVSSTGTEANGSARIRGIGTVGDNPGLESSVAVFIDGVYRSRSGIGLNELGEVERVEVLRGPQGTLFGRNASAGLIHVITRRPEFEFGGYGEVSYGNYDYIRGAVGLTGPIGEHVAFRLDAIYTRRDGFYDVVNAAGGTENDVNDRNRFFGRGQILFEPNDALSIRVIGDYSRRNESCCGATYISTLETYDATPGTLGDFAVRQPGEGGSASGNRIVDVLTSLGGTFPGAGDPFNRNISMTPGTTYKGVTTDWGISGQVDWELSDQVRLVSITAYRGYRSYGPSDTDYSNVDILRRADDDNSFRDFGTFSQELRFQGSAFGGVLDWLIGGYFASEDLQVRDNLTFGSQYGAFASCRLIATLSPNPLLRSPSSPGCLGTTPQAAFGGATARQAFGANFGALAPLVLSGLDRLSTVNNVGDNAANYYQESRNWAIFTHNIFNITDTLSLTLGLRYTHESKDFSATFNNTNAACPVQQAAFSPYLTGGPNAGLLTPTAQAYIQGIVNLTCQGNSTTSLNAMNLADDRSEGEWTGTGVVSWRPSNQLLMYASYSRGYKSGGFNLDRSALGLPIFSATDPRNRGGRGALFGTENLQFDAETVNSYEVGFKWTQPQFILNVAAFRQSFSNFQLNTFNGSVFLVQNVNGCSTDLGTSDSDLSATTGACAADDVTSGVTSTGVEVEVQINPARNLNITAGLTYADTKYRSNLVGRDTGAPLDPALFLLPGQNLSNAPEIVATGSVAWTPQLGGGYSALVYADTRITDDYNTGSDLFPEKAQDGYAIFNARLGIRGPGQRWAVEVWAQNLFNQDYQQVAFNTPFQGSNSVAHVTNFGGTTIANQTFSSYLAEPRTFGITGRFRF